MEESPVNHLGVVSHIPNWPQLDHQTPLPSLPMFPCTEIKKDWKWLTCNYMPALQIKQLDPNSTCNPEILFHPPYLEVCKVGEQPTPLLLGCDPSCSSTAAATVKEEEHRPRGGEQAVLPLLPSRGFYAPPMPSATPVPGILLEIASAVDFFLRNRHNIQRRSQQQLRIVMCNTCDIMISW